MKMPIIVIAEAGVNHNGDIQMAKRLVETAAEAKADYVKFQSFKAKNLVSPGAKKADYQMVNTKDEGGNQYDMLHSLELSHQDHLTLIDHCKSFGIKFMSSAFDAEGLDYLNQFDLDFIKCPSGEITNYPYLRKAAELNKRVILSTGMSSIDDISSAIDALTENGMNKANLTLLHCNTEYPTPYSDVNLMAMSQMEEIFGVEIGYSDHTLGIEVPIAAAALGATVIEKHFTLDRNLPGPDHKASLEPCELVNMVKGVRNIELAISGNGQKKVTPSEQNNIPIARKSIHVIRKLDKGTLLSENDIIPLRPGNGISPMQWKNVLGKELTRDMDYFEKLTWNDLR